MKLPRTLGSLIAAMALLVVVLMVIVRFSQERRETRYFESLRKAGYPVTLNELNQWYAAVPLKENAAALLMEAAAVMTDPADAKALPQLGLVQSGKKREPIPPEARAAAKVYLDANRETLRLAHEAAALTNSRYALDLNRGVNLLVAHLAKIKGMTQLLGQEAAQFSHAGDPDGAIESTVAAFAVARSLRDEPILISQLVRIACESIIVAQLEHLLSDTRFSDAQLQRLAKILQEHEAAGGKAMARSLAGERCFGTDAMTRTPGAFMGPGGASVGPGPVMTLYKLSGLLNRDLNFYLRSMENLIAAAERPFPASIEESDRLSSELVATFSRKKLLLLSRAILPALQRSIHRQAHVTGQLRAAQAAIGVERYRLSHDGKLPPTLQELAPAWIPELPRDPASDKPMRYEANESGYKIVAQELTAAAGLPQRPGQPAREIGFSVSLSRGL